LQETWYYGNKNTLDEGHIMKKTIVEINQTPVELYKILKFENIAASGGEAKFMINDGFVKVNGSIETRKRKKIYPGDIIKIQDIILEIQLKKESPAT
jgi:ribosome-associated protein